jgi:hypothetical protein
MPDDRGALRRLQASPAYPVAVADALRALAREVDKTA